MDEGPPKIEIKEKPKTMQEQLNDAMALLKQAMNQGQPPAAYVPMTPEQKLNPGVKKFVQNVQYPTEIKMQIGRVTVTSYHFDTATVMPWFTNVMKLIDWNRINKELGKHDE